MKIPYKSMVAAGLLALGSLGYSSADAQQVARDTTQATKPSVQQDVSKTRPEYYQKSLMMSRRPNLSNQDSTKRQSQTQPRTLHNRLLSRNPRYSATGEGVWLKDFVPYDLELTPDSKVNLDEVFGLYPQKGGKIIYEAGDRQGVLQATIKYLKNGVQTPEVIASIKYLEGLKNTPTDYRKSLGPLEKAVRDGQIDVSDSLSKNGAWQIEDGVQVIWAKSQTVKSDGKTYQANSIPIMVYIKTSSETEQSALAPKVNYDSLKKAVVDSLAGAARQRHDSLARAKKREDFVVDSLKKVFARENYVRDSTEAAERERAKEKGRVVVRAKSYEARKSRGEERLRTRFGLETAAGANEEVVGGVFVNSPLTQSVGLGGYVLAYFRRGKEPIVSDSVTEVMTREKELTGPGIYKWSVDETTTRTEERPVAEAGLEFLLMPAKEFEFSFRAGANLSRQEKNLYGKRTIYHERNQQLLEEPKVIENTMDGEEGNVVNLALSAGVSANITKNFSVGASFNRLGKFDFNDNPNNSRNTLRLNLKYSF